MSYDAIVIGGGPAGAATATALAGQGRAVALVEKATFPRRKVCGEFISAVSLALLDQLGVGDDVRRLAGPEVKRVGLYSAGPPVETTMPGSRAHAFGRALGRDVLDALLLDAAAKAGVTVLQPWQATAVVGGDVSRVTIEGNGEVQVLEAPVVIAAHGSWEPGSLPSQLRKTHAFEDYLGFKAHFRNAALPIDLMPLIAFPGGYGGMVWSDQGRMSLSCCIRRDALGVVRAKYPGVPAGEAVQHHVIDSSPAVAMVLGEAEIDGTWLAAGPIRPGLRPVHANDIFRVGNIAGESHPVIAEGISMALQGAWLLATELGRVSWDRAGREAAARCYASAWRRQFALRIFTASAVGALASRPFTAEAMRRFVGVFPASLSLGAQLSGKVAAVPGVEHA